MKTLKTVATAALLTAGLVAATPSAAAVTTFASFSPIGNGSIVWRNNGGGDTSTTWRANGTGGSLYTTSSAASVRPDQAVPSSLFTHFSFLQPALAPYVTNANAWFYLAAAAYGQPAVSANFFANFDFQGPLSGNFSFLSTAPITIGSTTYMAGSNLLSGAFDKLTIFGGDLQTSAIAVASTGYGGTITYSSDFLDFSPTVNRDISLSLTSLLSKSGNVNKGVNFTAGHALRSFRAGVSGSFSSDPAPLFNGVPEPEVWGMLLAGFGLVGVSVRRHRYAARSVAC